jgi:hypothetical protein
MRFARPGTKRLSLRLRQALKKISYPGSKTADLRLGFRLADTLQSVTTELNPKGRSDISLEHLRLGLFLEVGLRLAFRLRPS